MSLATPSLPGLKPLLYQSMEQTSLGNHRLSLLYFSLHPLWETSKTKSSQHCTQTCPAANARSPDFRWLVQKMKLKRNKDNKSEISTPKNYLVKFPYWTKPYPDPNFYSKIRDETACINKYTPVRKLSQLF